MLQVIVFAFTLGIEAIMYQLYTHLSLKSVGVHFSNSKFGPSKYFCKNVLICSLFGVPPLLILLNIDSTTSICKV